MSAVIGQGVRAFPLAQRAATVELQAVFNFLGTEGERAVCYRVCRAWYEVWKTPYFHNVLDYELSHGRVLSLTKIEHYIDSIKRNPASRRRAEVPMRGDSTQLHAAKIVAIIQRAALSIHELNLYVPTYGSFQGLYTNEAAQASFPELQGGISFPYVTKFSLNLERSPLSPTSLINLFSHFPALTELTLGIRRVEDVREVFERAPPSVLRILSLHSRYAKEANYEILESLEALKDLEELHLMPDNMLDEELEPLPRIFRGVKLHTIYLQDIEGHFLFRPGTTDVGISYLVQIQTLVKIFLDSLPYITDASLEIISHLPELESLEIIQCKNLSAGGISYLRSARKLSSLRLENSYFEEFPPISTLLQLRMLNIRCLEAHLDLDEIIKCRFLHTLIISSGRTHQIARPLKPEQIAYLKGRLPLLKNVS